MSRDEDSDYLEIVQTEIDDDGRVIARIVFDDDTPSLETVSRTEADAGFQLGVLFALRFPERISVEDSPTEYAVGIDSSGVLGADDDWDA